MAEEKGNQCVKCATTQCFTCTICIFPDEVPPLEDMSDELEKFRYRGKSAKAASKPTEKKQTAIKSKEKQVQGGFSGFKKGFLFSDPPEKKSATKKLSKQAASSEKVEQNTDEIPHIKKSKASDLELPEVQEAMKDSFPFLEKNGG